jgi:hypothetical protein
LSIYFEELDLLFPIPSSKVLYNLIEFILELITVGAALHVEIKDDEFILEFTIEKGVIVIYRVDTASKTTVPPTIGEVRRG